MRKAGQALIGADLSGSRWLQSGQAGCLANPPWDSELSSQPGEALEGGLVQQRLVIRREAARLGWCQLHIERPEELDSV